MQEIFVNIFCEKLARKRIEKNVGIFLEKLQEISEKYFIVLQETFKKNIARNFQEKYCKASQDK